MSPAFIWINMVHLYLCACMFVCVCVCVCTYICTYKHAYIDTNENSKAEWFLWVMYELLLLLVYGRIWSVAMCLRNTNIQYDSLTVKLLYLELSVQSTANLNRALPVQPTANTKQAFPVQPTTNNRLNIPETVNR